MAQSAKPLNTRMDGRRLSENRHVAQSMVNPLSESCQER